MNLVLFDIDGTLTQSFEYDREVFTLALADVINSRNLDTDLEAYGSSTSAGVTKEAFQRALGRDPGPEELAEVERRVLWHLEQRYRESPGAFIEIPGASGCVAQLRKLDGLAVAIATGCWRTEAAFKLQSSGFRLDGIPMATSDDDEARERIMETAVVKAGEHYRCAAFERVVSLGDGLWDLRASRSLGYGFVGIGGRIRALQDAGARYLHPDYLELEAVLASIRSALQS
jgi:phosphoglycolate phosphatase-like HAD superfamily hydrolase